MGVGAPTLDEVLRLDVHLGEVIDVGVTVRGHRRVVPITGGRAHGDGLAGRVLPAGADYQFIRGDGVTELEARYLVELDAGGYVYVDNRGFRSASPEDVARLTRGEPVDPERVYFRTTPRFETAVAELEWLSRTVFVGVAEREPDTVRVVVHAVR
jgi:hypothetical protein